MKVNIKNLKGQVFTIEIEPTQTICKLKQKIEVEKGLASQNQKIIFKGKTVSNQDQIQNLRLKQSDFLVVMGQVAKPKPKPKVEEKVEPQNVQEKKPEQKVQTKEQKKENSTESAANQVQLNQLIAMGFPRQQCIAALKAAFNDSGRAVQYLVNGIPPQINEKPANGSNPFAALNALPQFEQLRSLIQSDPNSLPQVLAQLAQNSPQLYNIIAQHPQQFQNLILQGGNFEDQENEGEELEEYEESEQNQNEAAMTPQQEAAITRLTNLGFSKLEATQAYIVCDKNEEMAANVLLDRLAKGDIKPQLQEQGGSNEEEDDDNLFN